MSDPRTYQIPTEQEIDCETCSWTNTATDWTDLRTGEWSFKFTCTSCGHLNKEHGNALDRGAANVLFVFIVAGVALVALGILGHSAWSVPLIIGGAWIVAAVFIIALFMGAKQGNDND